jgi:hypothetical protein
VRAFDLNTIVKAMLNYTFCMYKDNLTKEELLHLFDTIDYEAIEDRYLADDPRLFPYIHWDKITKMQAVRMAARNLDILNYVDLKKYQYRIREVFFLIKRDFNILFKYFNFDFENLTRDDAYFLLCLGSDKFYKMVDVKKYDFNFIEMINIIRAYSYNRSVITDLNYSELKNYQITEVLIMTGEESLDLFNLDDLNTLNWIDLLMYQPDFIYRCDFEKFIDGDPFNLVQLIVMFDKPDLTYLLDRIDLNKITPFGWEKLLISRPDKFANICDFKKLNEANWAVISHYSPELIIHKV